MNETVLQQAVAPMTRTAATIVADKRETCMPVLALETRRPAPLRAPLSEREKAMLFDLALAAAPHAAARGDAIAAAPLIEAFARAYVAIRDREDGLV